MNQKRRDRDNETRRACRPAEWWRQCAYVLCIALLALCIWASCAGVTLVLR